MVNLKFCIMSQGEETMSDEISVDVTTEQPITVAITSGALAASVKVGGQPFHFQDVRAASIDYVHLAIAGNGAEQIIVTNIENPDVARNASITVTNVDTPSGNITLAGINAKGVAAIENIAIIPGATAYGNVAWATLISITLPAGVSALDTVEIGISDKLGLSVTIILETNVVKKKVGNEDKSSEISGNVDITHDTIDCAVIMGHDDITIWTKERFV